MAKWAFWMMAVSVATVITTAVGIYYVRRTLNANTAAVGEARRANDIAEQNAITDRRAWLRVHARPEGNWEIQDGKILGTYAVSFENIGKTPASQVRVAFDTLIMPDDNDKVKPTVYDMFDRASKAAAIVAVIFPEERSTEFMPGIGKGIPSRENFYLPRVYIMVAYKVVGDTKDHYSMKSFDVMARAGEGVDFRKVPNPLSIPVVLDGRTGSEFVT